MPAGLTTPIGNRFYDWKYESEPEPLMHGRRVYHARGKVLGGSSSINGMIFQRGNPLDYERWGAEPGMKEWDYLHCLPYFKKMESCLAGEDDWRGCWYTSDPKLARQVVAGWKQFDIDLESFEVREPTAPVTAARYDECSGSTPITVMRRSRSFKKRPMPEMVPPEPMPHTKKSTCPSSWNHSSGAVSV